jgi:hypothetical protein
LHCKCNARGPFRSAPLRSRGLSYNISDQSALFAVSSCFCHAQLRGAAFPAKKEEKRQKLKSTKKTVMVQRKQNQILPEDTHFQIFLILSYSSLSTFVFVSFFLRLDARGANVGVVQSLDLKMT